MPKNIEIQINDEIYERLKSESVKYNMNVESYIPIVIEKYDQSNKQSNNYIEEKVKKPLKKILTDLEGLNGNNNDNSLSNKVLLLPLKIYTKPLPKGFSRLIEYYKSKSWYDLENFYLITEGKSIVGYLGLNISEEDAPYGRYLFIYGLNLYKEHQNITNLNYIINFVKSIGRQGQCYSIDILLENCNLTYDQLNELGFLLFTSADIIKIKEDIGDNKIDINYLESKKCDIEDIGEFLPVVRTEPLKPLLNQWLTQKKDIIEVCSNIYKDEEEEIKFIDIKEDKRINNIVYSYFTLLVDPKNLYDDKYISKVFSILNSIICNDIEKNKESIVSVYKDFKRSLSIYNDCDILDSISWLRKNNS